ncbi:MAG: efflux RND transporter periplasmic adaptor subunit [Burkholderiales bacterium]
MRPPGQGDRARTVRSVAPRTRFVLAALAACVALAACGERGTGAQPPGGAPAKGGPGGAGGPPPAMPVTAIEAKPQRIPLTIEAVAQTEGSREVEVRARVTGVLQKQSFAEGEVVKAGTPMFRIDPAPFEIALDQARAAAAQETANLEQARREAARTGPLAEQRAISQKEADDARSSVRRFEASLLAAQARVREAQLNLSYTTVTAPITGLAGRLERSVGSLVNPTTDSLLVRMAVTDPIWVRFSLSEPEWQRLRASSGETTVTLVMPDGSTYTAEGKLNFQGTSVDARLGTVQMRAVFANPKLALLPGQFVRARVKVGEQEAFVVPQAAVMTSEQGRFVWVVGPQGTAQPRPVRAGAWSGSGWAIQEGLAAGDRVIVDNVMKLRPGAPVAASAPGAAPPGGGAPGSAPGGAAPAGGAPAGGPPAGKGEPKAGGASS